MTTEVREYLAPARQQPPRSGVRSWLGFLIGIVLTAILIGVLAASLGRAALALQQAEGALGDAQQQADTAQTAVAEATRAQLAAQAEVDRLREEISAAAAEQGTTFSGLGASPRYAELTALSEDLSDQTAGRIGAEAALVDADERVDAAQSAVVEARSQLDATTGPAWIVGSAGVVLIALLALAWFRSRRRRSVHPARTRP